MTCSFRSHWQRLAQRASYDPEAFLAIMGRYVRDLPNLASDVATGCRVDGLDAPVVGELVDGIAVRCAKLATQYAPMADPAPAGPRP